MKQAVQEKTLQLLLGGKHPKAKKFAGQHVLVIAKEIIPLKEGKAGINDIDRLEKKYGTPPAIIFVPRSDVSYILACLK
jgi:hypothetical protein